MSSTLCLIWILPSVQLQLTSNRVLTETAAACCVALNSNNMSAFFASRPSCLMSVSRGGTANSSRERDSPTSTCRSRCCRNSRALWCFFAGLWARLWGSGAHLGATGFHGWCLAVKKIRRSKVWTLVGGRRLCDSNNCSVALWLWRVNKWHCFHQLFWKRAEAVSALGRMESRGPERMRAAGTAPFCLVSDALCLDAFF